MPCTAIPACNTAFRSLRCSSSRCIGQQLQDNVKSLNRAGVGLVIGLVGTFLGTRGLANAMQYALSTMWGTPYKRRPGFPWNGLRSLAIISVLGTGFIAAGALSGLGGGTGAVGVGVRVAAIVAAFALNVAVFWVVFRIGTVGIAWRDLLLGAFLTAVVWEFLLTFGGYLIAHDLKHMSPVYGTFALVLGLMGWLYLQAELTLYAIEVDVVRARRLWPRTMFGQDRRTSADESTYVALGEMEERRADENVDVDFTPTASRPTPKREANRHWVRKFRPNRIRSEVADAESVERQTRTSVRAHQGRPRRSRRSRADGGGDRRSYREQGTGARGGVEDREQVVDQGHVVGSTRRLRSHSGPGGRTKEQLYGEARRKNVKGRSTMTKAELQRAVDR